MNPILELKHITAGYDHQTVLHDINLTIRPNDFIGIIGPNGGGKTTLVKAILGSIPHSGEIRFAPELSERTGRPLIGYLPQQPVFDRSFPISVTEAVLSGLQAVKGFTRRYTARDRSRAVELLEMTGIAETARRPVGEISGGQAPT